jgi:hypothetical protein
MGQSVKTLVDHIREREEKFGVNAFRFDKVVVTGLAALQPASYPPDVQAVIDAGKSVKDWPKADAIPIDLRLIGVDETENPNVDNEDDIGSGSNAPELTSIPVPDRTDKTLKETENPDNYSRLSNEGHASPHRGDEFHQLLNDADPMDTKPITEDPYQSPANIVQLETAQPGYLDVMLDTKSEQTRSSSAMDVDVSRCDTVDSLGARMVQPPEQQPASDDKFVFPQPTITPSNHFQAMYNQDANSQQPTHFPTHHAAPQYYFPVPQQIGATQSMSSQMPNAMFHPFMGQMFPDQWGAYRSGHPYFHTTNQSHSGVSMSTDPARMPIDPGLLPAGPPTFTLPGPYSHESFPGQPPGGPIYANHNPVGFNKSASVAPYPNVHGTSALVPPKGTPSPKKSPTKRARTTPKAKAETPTRSRRVKA